MRKNCGKLYSISKTGRFLGAFKLGLKDLNIQNCGNSKILSISKIWASCSLKFAHKLKKTVKNRKIEQRSQFSLIFEKSCKFGFKNAKIQIFALDKKGYNWKNWNQVASWDLDTLRQDRGTIGENCTAILRPAEFWETFKTWVQKYHHLKLWVI